MRKRLQEAYYDIKLALETTRFTIREGWQLITLDDESTLYYQSIILAGTSPALNKASAFLIVLCALAAEQKIRDDALTAEILTPEDKKFWYNVHKQTFKTTPAGETPNYPWVPLLVNKPEPEPDLVEVVCEDWKYALRLLWSEIKAAPQILVGHLEYWWNYTRKGL